MSASPRNVAVDSLEVFAFALFRATGMDEDKAGTVGRVLVLTDMMGRRTHGLAMAPLYLEEIRRNVRFAATFNQRAARKCGTAPGFPVSGS